MIAVTEGVDDPPDGFVRLVAHLGQYILRGAGVLGYINDGGGIRPFDHMPGGGGIANRCPYLVRKRHNVVAKLRGVVMD